MKTKIIIPIAVGIMGFMFVVGTSILDFQNIAWLSKGDALFNYVGWGIFRYGPWTNPVGLNPNYGLEFGSSIVYSDSIPLLAIFFKMFSKFLGEPFQYFGLWLLLCFIFQAIFGYKLAELLTTNQWLRVLISTIFVFMPVMLFRMNVHFALAGHFVLLWALYLNLKKNISSWSWALLIFIVLGIHFYLFLMVFILWIGSLLDRGVSTSSVRFKSSVKEVILVALVLSIGAWQYGYLAISPESSSAMGYGDDQFNLVAFFNPLGWSLFIKRNVFMPPTIEGFAYIGAGVIGALILGAIQLMRKEDRLKIYLKAKKYKFMLGAVVVMLLIAITNNIDIGNTHYRLPMNEHLRHILSIVRSSVRLSWPFQYLIIYLAFWLIINGYCKRLVPLFALLCTLQIIDTSKGWKNLYEYSMNLQSKHLEHSLTNDFWRQAAKQYSVIKIVPPQILPFGWNTYAAYAVQNKMATNSVFLARVDVSKVQQAKEKTDFEISSGKLDPKTLYIFQKWSDDVNQVTPKFDSKRDLFAKINGATVLAPNYKLCVECRQVDEGFEISSMIPRVDIGEVVNFSNQAKGGEFLLDGWSHSEPWGAWSQGVISTIAIPLGNATPSKIEFNFRGMVGPKHPISNMKVFVNKEYQKTIKIERQMHNNFFISIPPELRHDKFVLVKLEYLNPSSPKNAGYGNQDDRMLTLGLESIKLSR